ncbi:MAG: anaerobic sulfatase-maturation protein [Bacteroidales bacterium]
MAHSPVFPSRPFYLMAKPVGSVCNLNCTYCYYLEKEKLYPDDPHRLSMSEKVLEQFIAQYIYSFTEPAVLFTWHGGEPVMRGPEFFQKVIALQNKYANGKIIENSLQTNGTALTDDWCKFFRDHRFLIGLSIDGPEHCHDRYRRYKSGRPSFSQTMAGLELLKKYGVEFNTLSVVNDYNAKYPLEVYNFLKNIGSRYMQFTPVVEWIDPRAGPDELHILPAGSNKPARVTDWSVNPIAYGDFLIKIFDEWVRKDVGDYFVVTFDCILANWLRVPPPLCVYAETCGHAGVVEYNGDVYSCDHFVFPEYRLGNIKDKTLMTFMNSPFQQKFGRDKRDTLPAYCRRCEYVDICTGECPKNRIIHSPDGEPGLNYLCAGFKKFYRHVEPYFDFMANEYRFFR